MADTQHCPPCSDSINDPLPRHHDMALRVIGDRLAAAGRSLQEYGLRPPNVHADQQGRLFTAERSYDPAALRRLVDNVNNANMYGP